jgi:hypothetical protein
MSLSRIASALTRLALHCAYLGRPHLLLPRTVRVRSVCFLGLLFAYAATSLLRHTVVGDSALAAQLYVLAVCGATVLTIATTVPAESALFLAAGAGVELSIAVLGVLGCDTSSADWLAFGCAWQVSATAATFFGMFGG